MSMQAVVQHRPGGIETLSLEVVERPMPGPGQLLVRVLAAGVNRADVVQREGHYPPPAGVTPLLGLEVAGIVEADFKVARRLKAFAVGHRAEPFECGMGLRHRV